MSAVYAPNRVIPDSGVRRLKRARAKLEGHIEHLIALLDQIDGDTEAEDDGSGEPSLGSLCSSYSQENWARSGTLDYEDEHDGREPDEDKEPTLGAPENPEGSQEHWGHGEHGWSVYSDGDDQDQADTPVIVEREVRA